MCPLWGKLVGCVRKRWAKLFKSEFGRKNTRVDGIPAVGRAGWKAVKLSYRFFFPFPFFPFFFSGSRTRVLVSVLFIGRNSFGSTNL